MKATSEQHYLIALKRNGPVGEFDVYKAAISMANIGGTYKDENLLPDVEKTLLEVRRLLSQGKLEVAEKTLSAMKTAHPLLEGDRQFLLAQYFHKKGDQQKASELMHKAADFYHMVGEYYRELRARSNAEICISSLESCLIGELLSLEQEARRQGFMDIVANICRTRAMELLIEGQLNESHLQAMEAADLYQLDGYPDDRAVALVLGAIALQMNGESERAQHLRGQCLHKGGKLTHYLNIFDALIQGKTPKLPAGHPLCKVKWNKNSLKAESVPGKIIQSLKEKPRSRDELILQVWGENAVDVSYCSRLYTAINYLKKSKGINVAFDGEKYKLA